MNFDPEKTCSNCLFFDNHGWQVHGHNFGDCKYDPPVFKKEKDCSNVDEYISNMQATISNHPRTYASSYCGKWQPAYKKP